MNESEIRKRKHKHRWLILPVLALVVFLLTVVAGRHPEWVEKWYSQGFYPVLANWHSSATSHVPFSLDDLFYIGLILLIPVLAFLLILRKISFRTTGKLILNILAAIYVLFYLFWGFNYFRSDLNTRLKLASATPNKEYFLKVMEQLIVKTNAEYCKLDDMGKPRIDSLVEDSYKKLNTELKLNYPAGKRKDKSITFSRFFASSGISGYYGPFFNEVHVNNEVLPLEYPVVLAHEKAHQFGVTGESEANFYAWLVCSQSDSPELNYSGNLFVLRYFFSAAQSLKEYPELVKMLDPKVQNDFNKIRKHWQALRKEKYERVASRVNDAYLKTNNVEAGIDDYYGIVKHVMDFSQDTTYQKRWNLTSNN